MELDVGERVKCVRHEVELLAVVFLRAEIIAGISLSILN